MRDSNGFREALRQIGQGFIALAEAVSEPDDMEEVVRAFEETEEQDDEAVRVLDRVEPAIGPDEEKVDVEPRTPNIEVAEANRRTFRDWARKQGAERFGYREALDDLGMSRTTITKLIAWAKGRGIIEDAGEEPSGPEGGRPRYQWRYVAKVPEPPRLKAPEPDLVNPAIERARSTGPKIANPDVRAMVGKLRDSGFKVEESGSGHLKVYGPNGRLVSTLPKTPSDRRALKNARAQFRRLGAQL